jgi:hypothetical protein
MIDFQYIYETVREVPVTLLTHWDTPRTESYPVVLPRQCRLRISGTYSRGDQYLKCYVVEDEEYESSVVPETDRSQPEYQGYSVTLKLSDITTSCIPVVN